MYKLPAVIFAGGKSSRMGKDKALLPFAQYHSLSEFQYQKLNKLFDRVYLSAKEDKFNFECPILKDQYKESSPLVGIVSLFEILKDEAVFILSVDAPLVDKEIIATLIKSYNDTPTFAAIIAKSPKGIEPLCGIYTRAILPLAKAYLHNNNHKLTKLLEESNSKFVPFQSIKPFTNLNTPEEYQATFL